MIDNDVLDYFTTASWLRGYASATDAYENKELVAKLRKAADMLDYVFRSQVRNASQINSEE